jgi:arsenite oxidase small subunit
MKSCDKLVELGRRQFLRGGAVAAVGAVTTTLAPREAEARVGLAQIDYASTRIGNVKDLQVNKPVEIAYPDKDSPGVLLKLGNAVEGGTGPDRDIVAFSTLCPHKGWLLTYRASDKTLNCQGHFSRFDCESSGQQIWGHATQNLPQFTLRIDASGEIFAEGVSDLIFGRPVNVL